MDRLPPRRSTEPDAQCDDCHHEEREQNVSQIQGRILCLSCSSEMARLILEEQYVAGTSLVAKHEALDALMRYVAHHTRRVELFQRTLPMRRDVELAAQVAIKLADAAGRK